jgi:hypothetical protein
MAALLNDPEQGARHSLRSGGKIPISNRQLALPMCHSGKLAQIIRYRAQLKPIETPESSGLSYQINWVHLAKKQPTDLF